ncbi:MAG TPA: PAS domain S-box protein [Bacteroidales bacterium]|nr:PAS domain S-box protein [Bacteroidales bacterium]
MSDHYKILIAEDNPPDAELAQREIRHVLASVEFVVVDTLESYLDALHNFKPDIVVSDFSMPNFDGMTVILVTKKEAPLIPVIIYTGSLNEETAAETVKAGAVDYVLKENSIRLRQGVLHALEIKQIWLERKAAEEKLRESEERFRILFEQAADGIIRVDTNGNIVDINKSGTEITGYTRPELLKMNVAELFHKKELEKKPIRYDLLNKGHAVKIERTIVKKDGSYCEVEMHSKMMPDKTYQSIVRDITLRKKTERELRESEERLNNLIQTLPVGVVIHTNGSVVFTNETSVNIMEGHKDMDVTGLNIYDFIHPDFREKASQRIRDSLSEKTQTEQLEQVFLTFSGKPVPVEVKSLPLMYKGIPSVLTIFSDISERKQAEKLLKESEAKYRTIFETTGTATIIIEEDTTISLVNTKFAELTGLPKNEIENKKSWTEFVVPEDLDQMVKMHKLRRTHPSEALRSYEFRFIDVHGTIKNILLHIDIIPGTKKSIASLLDFTDRKKAEEDLRKNRMLLRTMIDSFPMWLSAVTPDGNYFIANKYYSETFKIPLEQIEGHNFKDFFPPAVHAHHKKLLNKCVSTRKPVEVTDEIEFEKGVITYLIGSYTPLFDADGNLYGISSAALDITRQKQAEILLQESEAKYRSFFENTGTAIAISEEDTTLSLVNSKYAELVGLPKEEIENKKKFTDFMVEEDLEDTVKTHRIRIKDPSKAPKVYELRFKNARHEVRNVLVYTDLIPGTQKSLASLLDITDRKKAENLLKESESRFRTTFENAPIGMSLNHISGKFFQSNQAFCAMLGYTQQELLNYDFCNITHPDDIESSRLFIRKVLEDKGNPSHIEKRYIRKDGSVIWVITSASVLTDINEKPIFFIIQVLDITEQKLTEQKLKEAKNQLELVFDNGPDAILLTQVDDGLYIDSNKTFTKYTGYTPDDLSGKSTLDIDIWYNPQDRDKLLQEVRSKGYCHNLELIVKNKDGTLRPIEMSTEVIIIRGRPCLLSISRDIAERKKMEELLVKQNKELHQLNATKDRFFSIIAHDLKDPHNAIIGFSQILSENYDLLSEQDRKNYIKNILLSSQSLARLLQNLLEWAGSQTGRMIYNPETLDLTSLINETINLLQYQAKIKQIRLISDTEPVLSVFADVNMTRTVLRNLVSNAIKFTHRNGFVKISAYKIQSGQEPVVSFVEISVTDNGVGISKENLEKLFMLDHKVKTHGTEEEMGSGLGLILCKELVGKNKGYMNITSEENVGSTVSFTLPEKNTD